MTHADAVQAIRHIIAAIDLWDMRASGRLTISPLAFAQRWAAANEEGRRVLFHLIENPYRPEIMAYPILSALLYVMSHKEYASYTTEAEQQAAERQIASVVERARVYVSPSQSQEGGACSSL